MKSFRTSTQAATRTASATTPAAAKQIEISKFNCCGRKIVLQGDKKINLDMCGDCARARRENNLAAKRPLRQGIIAPEQVSALQSVVRAANHERAVALNAKAVAVVAQALVLETRMGWEEAWGRHLAKVADELGSAMTNPHVQALAAETFAG